MMLFASQKLKQKSSEQVHHIGYKRLAKLGFVRVIWGLTRSTSTRSVVAGPLIEDCTVCESGLTIINICHFSASSNSVGCDNERKVSWGQILPGSASNTGNYVKLWYDLFSDPSQWWDNRVGKPNARFPDFKHKETGKGLWLIDRRNPSWVASEIISLPHGLSIFSWAQRLIKFNNAGQYEKTMEHFAEMQQEGVTIDAYIFVHVLNACAALQLLQEGRLVHRQVVEAGCELNLHVGSSLVHMYAKCGSLEEASKVFDKLPTRDVVAWTAMIQGCIRCGEGLKALGLFKEMQREEVRPDSLIFVGVINACAKVGALEEGKQVHKLIIQSGCESDVRVGNSLVDMYSKCGSIDDAWKVFNSMPTCDVVGWNAMILACVKCGQSLNSLELFQEMQRKGISPNSVTFLALLSACTTLAALEEGRLIHKHITEIGCESDLFVANSLIDMYSKCGSIEDAWRVFNKIRLCDVVGWNAMILGYVKCGGGWKALELFDQMQLEGVQPDSRTFVGVLNACAGVAALEKGRLVHEQIIQGGFESVGFVGNSLVDMYAKCGSLDDAWRVFTTMPICDSVGWNAMIMGYAMHGLAKDAVAVFEMMSQAGSKVDDVTFISLLSACSHGGLVTEGVQYFDCMWALYGVLPKQEHYTCMVDILGRAGHLDDAESLLETMPLEPCAAQWISLLGACRVHGNVEMGKRASKRVLELDPSNSAGYVLLSNIYGAVGNWSNQDTVHEERLENRAMKKPVALGLR